MNDKQRNQVARLLRVQGFLNEHAGNFGNAPGKPGDAKFAAARTSINGLVTEITGKQAEQASGGFSAATTNQEVEREELLDLMRLVVGTAQAIAIEKGTPGIMDRFRMPASNSDVVLAAAGDAFADAIVDLSLATEITEHGYEDDIVADLRAEAADIRTAEQAQGTALSGQVAVTAALPVLLKEAANVITTLTSVIKIRFRRDPDMLAAWKTASHATATPKGDGGPPSPTPTPPTPPPGG